MKKIIKIVILLTLIASFIFIGNTYATALDTIQIQTNKTTIKPGEEVELTIQFGQNLGAYTFNIAYDNNIFEYVSSEGGTASDTTDKIKVVFYDSTGGTNPRTNMSVTFRAKPDITTSNPTEFTITGEGLSNSDASVTFDDITIPIVKNVTVEPEYVDYTLNLTYTGNILKDEEKEMTLSYSSPMGRYYEHARLIAEATTPEGATVQLLATDQQQMEHDIIQSGWGDAQGYKIGGKDVLQQLKTRGIFSENGNYTITLKLIDRDNSDQVIAQKNFSFTVGKTQEPNNPEEEQKPENTIPENTVTSENMPTELPKTGANIYIPISILLILLISCFVYYNKKK